MCCGAHELLWLVRLSIWPMTRATNLRTLTQLAGVMEPDWSMTKQTCSAQLFLCLLPSIVMSRSKPLQRRMGPAYCFLSEQHHGHRLQCGARYMQQECRSQHATSRTHLDTLGCA